ncbi:MAG: hypothetical protein KAW12_08375 [Candidatus Aminicenantes bacterium]|nr:hypothetical protein [Candidatus Aminicenantes bacterium]
MAKFGVFFLYEWKRFFSLRNLIILSIIWLLLFAFTIGGIVEYKELMDREEEFRETQDLIFKKFPNYDVYGDSGISVLYCPSALSIFFKDIGVSPELIGKLNSIVNLGIYDNYKSRSLFRGLFSGIWSFAGFIFLCGSLLCLFWAAELSVGRDYLKFLCSLSSRVNVFLSLVFSRLIILTLNLLLLFTGMYLLLLVNNINLPPTGFFNLYAFFGKTLFMLFFFFFLGLISGLVRRGKGFVLPLMASWGILVFLLPGLIQYTAETKTFGSIKDYRTEIKKFEMVSDFENRCLEKEGKFNINNIEVERKLMEDYYNNDYARIEVLENELKDELKSNIELFHNLSLITPSTSYYASAVEVSSRGYENFLDFYTYLQETKRKFVRFYIDRFYYNNPDEMVNFIKAKENLFYAKSRVPRHFVAGIILDFLFIFGLFILSFACFKRMLTQIEKKAHPGIASQELNLKKGELKVLKSWDEHFKDILYNLFSGGIKKKEYLRCTPILKLDGKEISPQKGIDNFLYIPDPEELPADIKVKHLLKLAAGLNRIKEIEHSTLFKAHEFKKLTKKKISQLSREEKARLLLILSSLKKSHLYLFYETALKQSEDFVVNFKEKMDQLKQEAVVIYLTSNAVISTFKPVKGKFFVEHYDWVKWVEHIKSMKKDE